VVDEVCADSHTDAEKTMELARQNVLSQIDNLRTHPSVAAAFVRGGVQLHGWVYDIEHGEIQAWSSDQKAFVPLQTLPIDAPQVTAV
jgi:carbonic anhydrase